LDANSRQLCRTSLTAIFPATCNYATGFIPGHERELAAIMAA
jgi:hypothetical protein